MAVRFVLYDRWGEQLRDILGVRKAVWTEEINGEDTLMIEADGPIDKGMRVVWHDSLGTWHEHIVAMVEQRRAPEGIVYVATCENSISELFGDYIADKRPENITADYALSVVLEPTRWDVGTVTIPGTASPSFYRQSCRECVQDIVKAWGGELSTTIAIAEASLGDLPGVSKRKVNISRRGSDNGRRFEYAYDMSGVSRTYESEDVVTALYGYGKGEATGKGYGRGINFAEVNDGKEYVEDDAAREAWGRPDGQGGKSHVFGKVEFHDCEDKRELLRLTKEELSRRCVPRVSYDAEVAEFARAGYDFQGVGIGDDVALVDPEFSPEMRVKGRVMRIVRDLLDDGRATDITIGNVIDGMAGMLADQYAQLQSLANRSTNWDVAAHTPSAYIQQVMDGLNKEFDAGSSYVYQSPEQGIVIGSVPLDENGRPTRTPASAIQLKGGGFRIADKLKSNGEFDWRTFGTGAGFTADEITAGVIKGGKSRWNLSTGDLYLQDGHISVTDAKGNVVSLDPTNGFQVRDKSGELIAGTELDGGASKFYVDRVGHTDEYLKMADLDSGYGGAELVQNGVAALRIEPFAQGGDRAGVSIYSGNTNFIRAYTEGVNQGRRKYQIGDIDTGMLCIEDGQLIFRTRTNNYYLVA